MLIGRVLLLSCYRKKLWNFSHLNCGLQICWNWIHLLTVCGDYCNRRCAKMRRWSGRTDTTEKRVGQAGSCRHCDSHSSVVLLIVPDQWCTFYIFSCNIFQILLPLGFKSPRIC